MARQGEGKGWSLGIDTSNYKTSVAIVDAEGQILADARRFLQVRDGERGLRQSEAFFQHIQQLPNLLTEALSQAQSVDPDGKVVAISVSDRPRPVEQSYMPVFTAGVRMAQCFALGAESAPLQTFSHQEGHVRAAIYETDLLPTNRFLALHFSGGTTEAVIWDGGKISIVGGTKDLAFGQVLDRTGVALGLAFPAGEALDQMALAAGPVKGNFLPPVHAKEGTIHLSGIESACAREIEKGIRPEILIPMLFQRLGGAMMELVLDLVAQTGCQDVLFAGGVSSSQYLRAYIEEHAKGRFRPVFGRRTLASDNAVGIALLGGEGLWP